MNSRERVLTALSHKEPDRIPLDLGGHGDSTILAVGYNPLRVELGLAPKRVRVDNAPGQTAWIDDDVRDALGIDTVGVFQEPLEWRAGTLTDGTLAELPARFLPVVRPDGSEVLMDGDREVAYRPAKGLYFDGVYVPLANAETVADIDRAMRDIETYDCPEYLDMSDEALAKKVKHLRETTDRALVGFFGGHIFQAGQGLRGWETFLVDLLTNRKLVEALLDRVADACIRRFDRFSKTVGQHLDVILFEDDLGMQDRPFLRPELYRQMIKPYHSRLYRYAKAHTQAKIMLHSDGAISPFIPDFIEMGIDVLNPVQVSATGMDTRVLKQAFGKDICFWGASCDSQGTLPFGTVQQVMDETKRHIDDMAPGGGYVFASIHNIQAGVPSANTAAMFRTAREYGVYRK